MRKPHRRARIIVAALVAAVIAALALTLVPGAQAHATRRRRPTPTRCSTGARPPWRSTRVPPAP